jgi:hypothetical protein
LTNNKLKEINKSINKGRHGGEIDGLRNKVPKTEEDHTERNFKEKIGFSVRP